MKGIKDGNEGAVQQLIDGLQNGDEHSVTTALKELGLESNSDLYQQVGEMARSLHESLAEFQSSLSPESITMESTNIPDAASKLEEVIAMTFQSANTVLSMSENEEKLFQEMEQELEEVKGVLDAEATIPLKVMTVFNDYYAKEKALIANCRECNQQILISQNFQDLSGQSIRKVIKLVTGLEEKLISLLRLFREPKDGETTIHELHGEDACSKADQSSGDGRLQQDDADSILKDLGF
ncbi:protein phosphatase CheZ [bacterium]|nr:protein phosphatase CheZ [bacterium]